MPLRRPWKSWTGSGYRVICRQSRCPSSPGLAPSPASPFGAGFQVVAAAFSATGQHASPPPESPKSRRHYHAHRNCCPRAELTGQRLSHAADTVAALVPCRGSLLGPKRPASAAGPVLPASLRAVQVLLAAGQLPSVATKWPYGMSACTIPVLSSQEEPLHLQMSVQGVVEGRWWSASRLPAGSEILQLTASRITVYEIDAEHVPGARSVYRLPGQRCGGGAGPCPCAVPFLGAVSSQLPADAPVLRDSGTGNANQRRVLLV